MGKLSAQILLFIFILSFILGVFPIKTYANNFAFASIRLDRQKISLLTGGQVCATTPSTDDGTESNVQIIFPTGFTVNSTASNWTTDTLDIPSDSTAWAGIGTATSVNGQIVTFPSGNLVTNTKYCFNFSSSNTLTTPSSTGSYQGTLRTRTGTTVIDSQNLGLSITSNDQISVTATVGANPNDFSANLQLINPGNGTVTQNTVMTYTLTYGSNITTNTSITPEISWDLGTIYGSGSPTVDTLEYVVGSATDAYGGVSPVIDTSNRTISWPISSLPGNTTGQTVTFQLRTIGTYTGSEPVTFTVNGRVLGPGTQTADSTITSSTKYTVTSPGDGRSDARSDGKTDGTIILPAFYIKGVEVRSISPTQASIYILTTQESPIKLSYGASSSNLNKTISSDSLSTQHLIKLADLAPNTTYYFTVTATNRNSEKVVSDLFTFRTALTSSPAIISLGSLTIVSKNIILYDAKNPSDLQKKQGDNPIVVIPASTPYSLKFKVENYEQVKNISIFARNNNVLGITNIAYATPASDSNKLIELSPGQYVTSLTSNQLTGRFQIVASIEDFNGNKTEQVLSILRVVDPMRVIESTIKSFIEHIKASILIYNQRLRKYEDLSPTILPIKNPDYSEPDGSFPIVLPTGSYRVEIDGLGFKSKIVDFTIGQSDNDGYPTIEIDKLPFNLMNSYSYFQGISMDLIDNANSQLNNLKSSRRFFDFTALSVLMTFFYLSILSMLKRFKIPFKMLPWFVMYHTTFLFERKNHDGLIQGVVFDSNTHEPVSNALVYISLPSGKISTHTSTNTTGEFFVAAPILNNAKITVSHKNYKNFQSIYSKAILSKRIEISIRPLIKNHIFSFQGINWYSNFIFSSLFETSILGTIVTEIVLATQFGLVKLLPFIILSIISLFLWASYNKNTKINPNNEN